MNTRPASAFIIDDSALFTYWLSAEVESKLYLCTHNYTNAEEAIADLERISPKIVLLDYHLGKGMNGTDVLVRVKQQLPDTCVAIVTNETDVDIVVGLFKLGADHVIRKNKNAISELLEQIA